MKKTHIVGLLALVILLLVGITARLVSDSADKKIEKVNAPIRSIIKESIEESREELAENIDMETIFMEGCMEESAPEAYCQCTYDYVLDDIGRQGFMTLAVEFTSGEMSDDTVELFSDAVLECLYLYEY